MEAFNEILLTVTLLFNLLALVLVVIVLWMLLVKILPSFPAVAPIQSGRYGHGHGQVLKEDVCLCLLLHQLLQQSRKKRGRYLNGEVEQILRNHPISEFPRLFGFADSFSGMLRSSSEPGRLLDRLKFYNFDLTKYGSTPVNIYKEKLPANFRFLRAD